MMYQMRQRQTSPQFEIVKGEEEPLFLCFSAEIANLMVALLNKPFFADLLIIGSMIDDEHPAVQMASKVDENTNLRVMAIMMKAITLGKKKNEPTPSSNLEINGGNGTASGEVSSG